MIKKIYIKNFRSIKELKIEPNNLCALVGPNSAGKTNVLKAIDLVIGEGWTTKAKVARELFNDPDQEIVIDIEFTEDIPHSYYSETYSVYRVSLRMNLYPNLSCEARLHARENDRALYVNEEFKKNCHFIYFPSSRELSSQMRISNWTLLGKLMKIIYDNYVNYYTSEEDLKEVFKGLMLAPKDFLEADFDQNNITFHKFSNTFDKYCKLNSAGIANSFSPELNIYNLNWFYKTLQISVTESTSDKTFDCEELGSGMQNLILLSIFQTYAELMGGKVIFGLEEPEIYLYPQAQRALYRNFQKLSEQSQILYTTHCQNFVDAARAYEVVMLKKDSNGTSCNIRSSFMNKMQAEKERFKIFTQFNTERNELFFAKKVILVEGDTEKMLISTICGHHWQLDLDSLGVSVIECGGKAGVVYFTGVCKLLGVTQYFGLWDKDKDVEKEGLLKGMLSNGNGYEFDPNLEAFINSKDEEAKLSSSGNKIKQIHDWVINCHPENMPSEFDALKKFILDEGANQEQTDHLSEEPNVKETTA
ncbi:ATP-dependent nuclease [Pontibacter sp. H249]|uniref:ATP-dependent nuclease n=1 Tax=Pontibacter sp. H249 TaxID=3133420 RepID=UPI0030C48E67